MMIYPQEMRIFHGYSRYQRVKLFLGIFFGDYEYPEDKTYFNRQKYADSLLNQHCPTAGQHEQNGEVTAGKEEPMLKKEQARARRIWKELNLQSLRSSHHGRKNKATPIGQQILLPPFSRICLLLLAL